MVFKAADKGDAVSILNNPMVVTELSTRNDTDGKLIWAGVTPLDVRRATGQEYAKWLAAKQVTSALVFLIDNTTRASTRPGLTPYAFCATAVDLLAQKRDPGSTRSKVLARQPRWRLCPESPPLLISVCRLILWA